MNKNITIMLETMIIMLPIMMLIMMMMVMMMMMSPQCVLNNQYDDG